MVGGVAFDLGLRGGFANALVVAGTSTVALGLLTDGRTRTRTARWLTLGSLVPATFLAVRVSPWLVTANVVSVGTLLAGAVAFSRTGSVADSGPGQLLHRVGAAIGAAWSAPRCLAPVLPRLSGRAAGRTRQVARGLLLAGPVLAVVVLLLASADAVFARLLTPDVDLGGVVGHVGLAVCGALVVIGSVGASSADGDRDPQHGGWGVVEVVTVLALTAVVLGLFVVSQVVALTGAGRRLVESSGLTPAEYARSGFFQLCWATGVLVVLLALLRALAAPAVLARPMVRALSGLVPLLGLGLVAVSLRRMALYDAAFGLTMLRLWVVGAAVWLGAVLVMVGLRNLGLGAGRRWVVAGAGVCAFVLVVVANVANPEAVVVRHNVARAEAGALLDAGYLGSLSDDAVPALVGVAAEAEDPEVRRQLLDAIRCDPRRTGAAALNLAVPRAERARSERCELAVS